MSYLDSENPSGFSGEKILTKTVITSFWLCSYKKNAIISTELHFLIK